MSIKSLGIDTRPEDLLVPTQVLALSLKEASFKLMNDYRDLLVPNPPGIYHINSIWPVIKDTEAVFNKEGEAVLIKSIEEIKEDLYNEAGEIVLSVANIRRTPSMFNMSGYYPISALQILKYFIDKSLRSYCRYSSPFTIETGVERFLIDESEDTLEDGVLEDYVGEINDSIYEFVKNDEWSIYFTKVRRDNIYIEKTIDFRIYDWTRTKYEEQFEEEGDGY